MLEKAQVDSPSVWFVEDTAINAASMGRGVFVLWTGLASLPDESLDAIFAHEIAHEQLQHSRNMAEVADLTNFLGEILSTVSAADPGTERVLRRWSGKFVIPRYSQKQELEADARAVRLLDGVGYNDPPGVICRTFKMLRKKVGEGGGGFFASHPGLTNRIAAIRTAYPQSGC
jgi:Zn-dependent protease with chaperone function